MSLTDEDLGLRAFTADDAEERRAFYQRNRLFFERYSGTRPEAWYSLEGQQRAIASVLGDQERDEGYAWGVYVAPVRQLIGTVGLSEVIRGPFQAAWIGYSFDESHTGRGYATRAVRLVTAHAFAHLHLHRLEAGVMPHNEASIRVLQKAGYHREGLMRKNVCINGQWEDHWHFARINPDSGPCED